MSDYGAIGFAPPPPAAVRILLEWPGTTAWMPGRLRTLADVAMTARAAQTAPPVEAPGYFAMVCHTPGVLRFEAPVEAGTTYAVSVTVQVNAAYRRAWSHPRGQLGARRLSHLRPWLQVTRVDGLRLVDTMADVADTPDTLTVAMPVLVDGVLDIHLGQLGSLGDSTLFLPTPRLATLPGPRCWWWALALAPG